MPWRLLQGNSIRGVVVVKRNKRSKARGQVETPNAARLATTEKALKSFFVLGDIEPLLGRQVSRELSSLWRLRQSGATVMLFAYQVRLLTEAHFVRYAFLDDDELEWRRSAEWALLLPKEDCFGVSKMAAEHAAAGKKPSRAEFLFGLARAWVETNEFGLQPNIRGAVRATLELGLAASDVTLHLRPQYLVGLAAVLVSNDDPSEIPPDDMVRAERCCREVLEKTEKSAIRSVAYANLGTALMAQATINHHATQAQEAVDSGLRAFNLATEVGFGQIEMAIKLSNFVMTENELFGTSSISIGDCCSYLRASLQDGQASSGVRARALNNLGLCLAASGANVSVGKDGLSGEAEDAFQKALESLSVDSDYYQTILANWAGQLINSDRAKANVACIDAGLYRIGNAIENQSAAMGSSQMWNNYAQLLKMKAELSPGRSLEPSLEAARRAVDLASSPSHEFGALLTFADNHLSAFEQTRAPNHASSTLYALRRLKSLQSKFNFPVTIRLKYANLLVNLSESVGDADLLSEAIDLQRSFISVLNSEMQCKAQVVLAEALRKMYLRTMNASHLYESYAWAQKALTGLVGSEARQKCLLTTGLILQDMSALTGDIEPLLEAMTFARSILDDSSTPEETRLKAQNNLGIALRKRHEADGDSTSLSESIRILRNCVDMTPDYDTDLPVRLGNLANALLTQVRSTQSLSDAKDALNFAERGLSGRFASRSGEVSLVTSLALAMSTLYDLTGDVSYVEGAIDQLRVLLHHVRQQGLPEFQVLANLSSTLVSSMRSASDIPGRSLFLEVLEMQRQSATLAEDVGSADAPKIRIGEATLLWVVGNIFGDEEALIEAETLAKDISSRKDSPVSIKISACELLGRLFTARRDFASAARLYGEGVGLLADLAWPGLDFVDRHNILDKFSNLSRDAAACAISSGNMDLAVELLETGRGVLLSQMLGTDVHNELADCPPDLVQRLSSLNRALHGLHSEVSLTPSEAPFDVLDQIQTRTSLLLEHEEVLREIRALPGLEKFGLRLDIGSLLRGLGPRKVVLINISQYRCDALLVGDGSVQHVPLPQLSAKDVDIAVQDFLQGFGPDTDGIPNALNAHAKVSARSILVKTLDWLWRTIGEHVIRAVKDVECKTEAHVRLWWCPTGRLALLPIHAASSVASIGQPGNGESVADHVIGSYAPTIRSLLRGGKTDPLPTPRSLVVAVPAPKGLLALKLTEVSSIKSILPFVEVLRDSKATRAAVLGGLSQAAWVHFAGHAVQDLMSPELSCLRLHEEELTVRDLAGARVSGNALMFLSACSTAQSGLRSPDETLSLTSAAVLCGFAHVVGTKWPVSDASLAAIAESFYRQLQVEHGGRPSPDRAAAALHRTLLSFRLQNPLAVAEWSAAVHIGL